MAELTLTLLPVTFDRFEDACFQLGWDPDEILQQGAVKEARLASKESGLRFLSLLFGNEPDYFATLDELDVKQLAVMGAIEFFTDALRQMARANRRALRYAERCGVESLLGAGDGGAVALAISALEPSEETHLRNLPLGEMLYRLSLRGIKHISDNPQKYLT